MKSRKQKKTLLSRTIVPGAHSLALPRKEVVSQFHAKMKQYCFPELSHEAISEVSSQHSSLNLSF